MKLVFERIKIIKRVDYFIRLKQHQNIQVAQQTMNFNVRTTEICGSILEKKILMTDKLP